MYRTDFWTLWERARVGWFGRMALKHDNIICEMNRQSRFDAGYRVLGASTLGWPRGMVWGGRWEWGSEWGTHVHPWWIHDDVWQNQYNKVKNNNNKIKLKKKRNADKFFWERTSLNLNTLFLLRKISPPFFFIQRVFYCWLRNRAS